MGWFSPDLSKPQWGGDTKLEEAIERAARDLGKILANTPEAAEFQLAVEATASDPDAFRLKAELEATYDDLIQRQSAGEILSRGEIDAFYTLEQRVRSHPLLARHEASLERLKDVFSEAHNLLSGQLGFNFKDPKAHE